MSDEKQEGAVSPEANTNTGSEPKADNLVDNAYKAAERLEAANKKAEEIANRIENALAKQMLGGRSEAGQPIKTHEQVIREKAEAEATAIAKKFRR